MLNQIYSKVCLVFILVNSNVCAGVRLENGNFYMTYEDMSYDEKLKIQRTYNSFSSRVGLFGRGWGSDYETYLIDNGRGDISIRENGTGRRVEFSIQKEGVNIDNSAKQIVQLEQRMGYFKNETDYLKRLDKLNNSLSQRKRGELKYQSLLPSSDIIEGIYESERSKQTILKNSHGYTRKTANGLYEYFNFEGHLIRTQSSKGYIVNIFYDKRKRLSRISDNAGNHILFQLNKNGRVIEIQSSIYGEKASYLYQGSNLSESRDVDDNVYQYEYDRKEKMTKITYKDKPPLIISYNERQRVESLKEPDGMKTEYSYGCLPLDCNNEYYTIVNKYNSKNSVISHLKKSYSKKTLSGGERFTRLYTVEDLITKKIIEKFESSFETGYPYKAIFNGQHAEVAYSGKYIIKTITDNFEAKVDRVEVDGNSIIKKLSWVDFKTKKRKSSNFNWSNKAILQSIQLPNTKVVLSSYGSDGRLLSLKSQDQFTKFSYPKEEVIEMDYSKLRPSITGHAFPNRIELPDIVEYYIQQDSGSKDKADLTISIKLIADITHEMAIELLKNQLMPLAEIEDILLNFGKIDCFACFKAEEFFPGHGPLSRIIHALKIPGK